MRLLANLFTAAVLAISSMAVAAGPASWTTNRFVYRADGKKLTEVLADFGASQSIPVVVDPGVEGSVNASFETTGADFLRAISKTYGVIWYFDGVTLFVYPARAMQSRVFRLRGFDSNQVRNMLSSFGLGDTRFPLRYNEAEQTVFVYGPPRHLELVATAIGTLEQGSKERSGNTIRIVPLKYAVAADRASGATQLAGLATTLNRLFNAGRTAANGRAGSDVAGIMSKDTPPVAAGAEKRRALEQTYGFKSQAPADGNNGSRNESGSTARGEGSALNGAMPPRALPAPDEDKAPYFEADPGTNAVIINGLPERMPQYEALVNKLDVAQDLVEIEATIIDVSSDAFNSLGIDWNFSGGRSAIGVQTGVVPVGGNVTTLLTDAGRELLARIHALEGNGQARIVARPKVLGSANRTATMVDKRVASVKVAGNLDANLFSIEAGTTLQVQPQIVAFPDRSDVKLTLFIQDGNFESAAVDQIPIVKRTEINTEATIRQGESLLIGGISVDSDVNTRNGLPGLSRIPVLGAAFRTDEVKHSRSERLFLITPKVIKVDGTPSTVSTLRTSTPTPTMGITTSPMPPARPSTPPAAPSARNNPAATKTASMPGVPEVSVPTPLPTVVAKSSGARPIAAAATGAQCAAAALGLTDAACGNAAGSTR